MSVFLFLFYYHPALLACGLLLLLLTWLRYVWTCHQLFVRLGIPGPRPSFLVGNAFDFANKFPMDVFKQWTLEFGPVFGFYEGLRPSVVVCCPDLAHKVLIKHFNKFSTRPVINPFMHDHEQLSLQNASGPYWKRQRQAVSAGMNSKSIKEMFPIICDVTDQLISWFDEAIDHSPSGFYVDDIIERYSIDWFSHAALGYHSDALANESNLFLRYMRASHQSMSPDNAVTGLAKLFPRLTCVLKPFDWQHKRLSRLQTKEVTDYVRLLKADASKLAESSSHSIIYNLATKKVSTANPKQEGGTNGGQASDRSFKSLLEEREVVGEVSGLVGGGVGPFSSTLTFCLHCLAVHQTEQDRLREELESVINKKSGVTLDALSTLHRMDRFLKETLRCYPVAPGVSRECVEDCVLDGVRFRKGMVVRVMFSSMYNQEKYFPEPDRFLPDRFQDDDGKEDCLDDLHRVTPYMPFGVGPRMCVGRRLAQVTVKLALARIVLNFKIERSDVTQTSSRMCAIEQDRET